MGASWKDSKIYLDSMILDPFKREISFDAHTTVVDDILELLIATPKGRVHETLLTADIDPFKLQLLLHLLNANNGARKLNKYTQQGDLFRVEVQPIGGGRRPIEEWVSRYRDDKRIPPRNWVFVGTSFSETKKPLATAEGNVLLLWSEGQTILDNPCDDGDSGNNFQAFKPNLPPAAFTNPVPVKVFIIPLER